jgi:nucleoid DNA-binding protein
MSPAKVLAIRDLKDRHRVRLTGLGTLHVQRATASEGSEFTDRRSHQDHEQGGDRVSTSQGTERGGLADFDTGGVRKAGKADWLIPRRSPQPQSGETQRSSQHKGGRGSVYSSRMIAVMADRRAVRSSRHKHCHRRCAWSIRLPELSRHPLMACRPHRQAPTCAIAFGLWPHRHAFFVCSPQVQQPRLSYAAVTSFEVVITVILVRLARRWNTGAQVHIKADNIQLFQAGKVAASP